MSSFGEWLSLRLGAAGFTQGSFAAAMTDAGAGVSQQRVSLWARGDGLPGRALVPALVKVLKLTEAEELTVRRAMDALAQERRGLGAA